MTADEYTEIHSLARSLDARFSGRVPPFSSGEDAHEAATQRLQRTAAPTVAGGRDARPVPAREDFPSAPAGLLRDRAIEHMVGGRVVSCWHPSLCELCSPVPITGRLDPYRLRVAS